jgi:hypothetical protein
LKIQLSSEGWHVARGLVGRAKKLAKFGVRLTAIQFVVDAANLQTHYDLFETERQLGKRIESEVGHVT